MALGLIGGAVSGIGSIFGGGKSAGAAEDAAKIQARAATNAANLQGQEFLYSANRLAPYADIGFGPNGIGNEFINANQNLYGDINRYLNPVTNSIPNPTTTAATAPTPFQYGSMWGPGAPQLKTLESTPGYQFTLQQGLRGVQNSAAAQGRGVSGNALAGAAKYTTGLANQTFNDQFKNALLGQGQSFAQTLQGQQQQFAQPLTANAQRYSQTASNIYNPINTLLSGLTIGQNAAAMQGTNAINSANAIGNTLTSGAAAQAAGLVGAANAQAGGLTNAGNSLSNALLYNQLFGGSGGGGGIFGAGSLFGSQGPIFGNAADASIRAGGPPLA